MSAAIPFDAVLFDLDGTLVATDGFWPVAADRGCRRAFSELGLERERPTAGEWMSLVGLPLSEGFDRLFADLAPDLRAAVFERVVEAEHEALAAGGAALYADAPDVLATLRAAGCRLGIASNCGRDYLEAMLADGGPGLGRWIDEARCLDSPGIANKADMVADLLATFDTRSAVMVGDRDGDRAAAHANGLPHVHLRHGFAVDGERVVCEAELDALGELPARLGGRDRWIGAVLDELGLARSGLAVPRLVGLGGGPCSGKRLFARDAVRWLERRDVPARVFELEPTAAELLGPDGAVRADASCRAVEAHRGPGVLFVVGCAVLAPRIASHLDRSIWLEVDERTALARARGRDPSLAALERLRAELEHTRALTERWDPTRTVDAVVRADNPLGPPPEAGP